MLSDRRVLAGGAVLIGFVAVMYAVTQAFAPETFVRAALSDIAMLLVEAVALTLTCLALRKHARGPYRWAWVFLALWLISNLFADLAWAWYELVLRTPLPSPSLADLGYLISYPLGFLTVVVATWKNTDKLGAAESALDAMMVTLGVAGICWSPVLAPLIRSSSGGNEGLVTLAYPLGDLLVIAAFAALLLGAYRSRPPRFLIIVWAAFLIQVVADSAYFVQTNAGPGYTSGSYLDSLWALVFALAGVAALVGLYPEAAPIPTAETSRLDRRSSHATLTYPRILLPYFALPAAAVLIWSQSMRDGGAWTIDIQVLVYITVGLIVLVVARQFIMLVQNRRLADDLSVLSEELGDRVLVLAGLTSRLEELNNGAVHLNSLRSLSDITQDGLELACSVTRAEAGWITLKDGEGAEPVTAVFGDQDALPEIGQPYSAAAEQRAEEVELDARGERIGSLWLARPTSQDVGPDLVRAVGAQVAIAIDNTRRYEEVLRLAERDPLTGLYNHRGIHQRLALEGRRAQQRGGALSLVMIDLDDFKLLNDTYGHPAGDRVLGHVSDTIRAVLRCTDLAGRVGGDEMMLVLPDTDRDGAMQMAQRLQQTLSQKPFVPGKDRGIPLHLSLGVATYPSDADTLTGLVGVADASLYASKQRGGDTITEAATRDDISAQPTTLRGIAGRLMDALGSRDHYTRRHSDQVAVHALKLAEVIGLPEQSLDTLKLAAMLHDVGKIGLGTRILRKPAPLTDEEERSQRLHIDIGEAIIRDLPRVAEILEAVHTHHERYDGSGYPAGLLGEDIPLLARILAVADAYAAMTVDRPYRAKLTGDQAKAELVRAAGSQLDPELVDAFVTALDKENKSRLAAAG